MAREIERKFLLKNEDWRRHIDDNSTVVEDICQGYIARSVNSAIRVRITGERAHLNIKIAESLIERHEFEYDIPLADARVLFEKLCAKPALSKLRHKIRIGEHIWEVDEFGGDNKGLVIAELELSRIDEPFTLPDWVGEEVSHDPRYLNQNLVQHPYKYW